MGTAPSSRARPCRAFSPFHPFPAPSRGRRDVLGTERCRGRLSQPIAFSHPSCPEGDSRDPRDLRDPSCFSPKEGAEHRRGTRRWPRSHGKGSATRSSSLSPPEVPETEPPPSGSTRSAAGIPGRSIPGLSLPCSIPGGCRVYPQGRRQASSPELQILPGEH